jgi:hypothetical protein
VTVYKNYAEKLKAEAAIREKNKCKLKPGAWEKMRSDERLAQQAFPQYWQRD